MNITQTYLFYIPEKKKSGLDWHEDEQTFLCSASCSNEDAIFPELRYRDDIWGHSPLQAQSIFPPKGKRSASWDGACGGVKRGIRGIQEALCTSFPHEVPIFQEITEEYAAWTVFPSVMTGASASNVIFTLGCGALCRPAEILSEETAVCLSLESWCVWSD